uniref:Uncharacterized protein n=1 Tax=Heterorhabditis bacteriophora TaxID=37862 RepID=A0A1I7WZG9_HETBA
MEFGVPRDHPTPVVTLSEVEELNHILEVRVLFFCYYYNYNMFCLLTVIISLNLGIVKSFNLLNYLLNAKKKRLNQWEDIIFMLKQITSNI